MDIFTPFDHNLVIRRLDSINYAVFVGQMTPGKPLAWGLRRFRFAIG